jgi:hypothetical protein
VAVAVAEAVAVAAAVRGAVGVDDGEAEAASGEAG